MRSIASHDGVSSGTERTSWPLGNSAHAGPKGPGRRVDVPIESAIRFRQTQWSKIYPFLREPPPKILVENDMLLSRYAAMPVWATLIESLSIDPRNRAFSCECDCSPFVGQDVILGHDSTLSPSPRLYHWETAMPRPMPQCSLTAYTIPSSQERSFHRTNSIRPVVARLSSRRGVDNLPRRVAEGRTLLE